MAIAMSTCTLVSRCALVCLSLCFLNVFVPIPVLIPVPVRLLSISTDNLFGIKSTTQEVYDTMAKGVVTSAMEGIHGQTRPPSVCHCVSSLLTPMCGTATDRHGVRLRPDQQWQDTHNDGHERQPRRDTIGRAGYFQLCSQGALNLPPAPRAGQSPTAGVRCRRTTENFSFECLTSRSTR